MCIEVTNNMPMIQRFSVFLIKKKIPINGTKLNYTTKIYGKKTGAFTGEFLISYSLVVRKCNDDDSTCVYVCAFTCIRDTEKHLEKEEKSYILI